MARVVGVWGWWWVGVCGVGVWVGLLVGLVWVGLWLNWGVWVWVGLGGGAMVVGIVVIVGREAAEEFGEDAFVAHDCWVIS